MRHDTWNMWYLAPIEENDPTRKAKDILAFSASHNLESSLTWYHWLILVHENPKEIHPQPLDLELNLLIPLVSADI